MYFRNAYLHLNRRIANEYFCKSGIEESIEGTSGYLLICIIVAKVKLR